MERTLTDCPLPEVALASPYRLRSLRPEEAAVWTALQNRIFGPNRSRTYEEIYCNRPYDALEVLLACRGREPVGICAAAVRRTEAGARFGYVDWLGVLAEHRGRRVGAALLVACINRLATWGLTHAALNTAIERKAAVALYTRLGFVEVHVAMKEGSSPIRQRADAGYPPLEAAPPSAS